MRQELNSENGNTVSHEFAVSQKALADANMELQEREDTILHLRDHIAGLQGRLEEQRKTIEEMQHERGHGSPKVEGTHTV